MLLPVAGLLIAVFLLFARDSRVGPLPPVEVALRPLWEGLIMTGDLASSSRAWEERVVSVDERWSCTGVGQELESPCGLGFRSSAGETRRNTCSRVRLITLS